MNKKILVIWFLVALPFGLWALNSTQAKEVVEDYYQSLAMYAQNPASNPKLVTQWFTAENVVYNDIYGVITELVSSYRIDPAKLHLEITESAVIDNAQDNIEVLRKLREAGFIVEMDDFGSGYSSLNMLKEIPLDVLKIDMVFLKESANNNKSSIILQSIIDMANKLNLSQITEGVETREQLDMLKEMGCKLFQGYYFSKPIPLDEFEKLPPKIN